MLKASDMKPAFGKYPSIAFDRKVITACYDFLSAVQIYELSYIDLALHFLRVYYELPKTPAGLIAQL